MIKISDALPVQFYLNGEPSFNEKIEQGVEHHCFFQPFNQDDPIGVQGVGEDSYRLEVLDSLDARIALLDFDRVGNTHFKSFKPEDLSITNQKIKLNILKAVLDASWTSRTSAADNNWSSVAYGNGIFVAVSTSGTGNRVMTSPDGITWTIRSSAADQSWNAVAFGNGLFVAVSSLGTQRVMTSPDGITWTLRTNSVSASFKSITFGGGLFVALSDSGTSLMTSPDGINWTTRTYPNNRVWNGITYGNGKFVAVAQSGTTSHVMTSPDGITWTTGTTPETSPAWQAVTFGNGIFVAVANANSQRVATSPDGITWTLRTVTLESWGAVCFGGGRFVAVSSNPGSTNSTMYSIDGITWTAVPQANTNDMNGVAFGNHTFVAVGDEGTGNRAMSLGETYVMEAYTDLLDIQPSHKHTNLLQYSNETDFAGLIYEGITPTPSFGIRITSKFFKRRNPEENESESLSDGSVVKLLGTAKKQRLLQVEPAPPYLHDKLTLILQHNTIYMDNRSWVKEEAYETEELDEYSAMSLGKAWLTQASDNYVTNPFS